MEFSDFPADVKAAAGTLPDLSARVDERPNA